MCQCRRCSVMSWILSMSHASVGGTYRRGGPDQSQAHHGAHRLRQEHSFLLLPIKEDPVADTTGAHAHDYDHGGHCGSRAVLTTRTQSGAHRPTACGYRRRRKPWMLCKPRWRWTAWRCFSLRLKSASKNESGSRGGECTSASDQGGNHGTASALAPTSFSRTSREAEGEYPSAVVHGGNPRGIRSRPDLQHSKTDNQLWNRMWIFLFHFS